MKSLWLFVCLLMIAVFFVFGQKVYTDRSYCRKSKEAVLELHNLNNKIHLQSFVSPEQSSGFKSMMDNGAVFLTKLREYTEMYADLLESLQKSGLSLETLELVDKSAIPEFSDNNQSFWQGELSSFAPYEPKDEHTFQTQKWLAKITAKKDVLTLVKTWLENNKKNGTIALLAEKVSQQEAFVVLHFSTGMIPVMKMPKRVLNIEQVHLPIREPSYLNLQIPDIFAYQACAVKHATNFEKLKNKILANAPKMLVDLEKADRMKWFWLASTNSKAFIDKTRL